MLRNLLDLKLDGTWLQLRLVYHYKEKNSYGRVPYKKFAHNFLYDIMWQLSKSNFPWLSNFKGYWFYYHHTSVTKIQKILINAYLQAFHLQNTSISTLQRTVFGNVYQNDALTYCTYIFCYAIQLIILSKFKLYWTLHLFLVFCPRSLFASLIHTLIFTRLDQFSVLCEL